MALFEKGRFDGTDNRGWAIGQFIKGPRHSTDVEVKWAHQPQGPAGVEWRTCTSATTLSVLVSGKFRIEFRGSHTDDVVFEQPGDYVIFGPGIEHRSTALEDTLFLTIRWPSINGDCHVIKEEDPPEEERIRQKRLEAIRHVVHEYANFVSSAEMVRHGLDINGVPFKPPINTHVSHAFYLNCRKLADFFQNRGSENGDDIKADHYVSGFQIGLPVSDEWRGPINKQLAHTTYSRDTKPREITKEACAALYDEIKAAWQQFRAGLVCGPYETRFRDQIIKRKEPHADGTPSEFRFYDLD